MTTTTSPGSPKSKYTESSTEPTRSPCKSCTVGAADCCHARAASSSLMKVSSMRTVTTFCALMYRGNAAHSARLILRRNK